MARTTGALDPTSDRIQRIAIKAGWNLLTLAVEAVEASDAAAQLGIGSHPAIIDAYRWNLATQNYDTLTVGSPLPAGSIVWLNASAAVALQVLGSYAEPTSAPVTTGGSFVSVPGLAALDLDRALPPEVEQAWLFDAETQAWQGRFTGTLDFLSSAPDAVSPGDVIYLQSSGPSQLTLPSAAEQIRYYHQDHLGSSNVVADGDGAVVEELAFYPFGHPRNAYRPGVGPAQAASRICLRRKRRTRKAGCSTSRRGI